jgi:S1-C subfamily serine protease
MLVQSVFLRRLCAGLLVVFPFAVCAADTGSAQAVFASVKDQVVQVRLIDQAGNAKTALGSGFVVSGDGRIVSNYHVVSGLVNHPERFRAEYLDQTGKTGKLDLLDIDVVHDLALLRAEGFPAAHFEIRSELPAMGERLYSMGNPYDLGLTIVEGTYNGLLQKSLYERIHFTGSINHGMSGGPALDTAGRVIGVNVASAGNQVSFLVPAKYVSQLIERAHDKALDSAQFDATIAAQLTANQQHYIADLIAKDFARTDLGAYSVPGALADYINCWGRTEREPRLLYHSVSYHCSTDENLFLSDVLSSGSIKYSHVLYSADGGIWPMRFFHLMASQAGIGERAFTGDEEAMTNFRCTTDFVAHDGLPSKVTFCLRAYRKFDGLYDVFQQSFALRNDSELLESTLSLTGISADNARAFARKFQESIAWKP